MKLRTWVLIGTWIILSLMGGIFGGAGVFFATMFVAGFFIGVAALFIAIFEDE